MDLKVFVKMFLYNGRTQIARKLYEYMQYRFGKKADVCVVAADNDGNVIFSTSAINGIEDSKIDGEKLCKLIRVKCGQQLLNTYGLTPPGKEMPVLAILPTPSLLRAIGFANFVKLIRAWPGESKVGDAVVVKYILWKEMQDGLPN